MIGAFAPASAAADAITALPDRPHPTARHEFRTFGQHFDEVQRRFERLTTPGADVGRERESDEWYIISRASDVSNAKIRDDVLDLKTWIGAHEGLEQWEPRCKLTFPVDGATLRAELFAALAVTPPPLPDEPLDRAALLTLVRSQPMLAAVRVHKRRIAYHVHGTLCEYAVVLVNGARVVTVSVESTDTAAIRRVMDATGMTGYENINYLQAIKRVIGMSERPLAN